MPAPLEVVEVFIALPEEEKVEATMSSPGGPYFLYEGYEITLKEVSDVYDAQD